MERIKRNEKKREPEKEEIRETPPPPPRACELSVSLINKSSGAFERGISRERLCESAAIIGMSAAEVNQWQAYMDQIGWCFSNGQPLTWQTYRRSLRMWHIMRPQVKMRRKALYDACDEEEREKKKQDAAARKLKALVSKPESWILCQERCANYIPGQGCKCGVKIPPAHQERQIPPEDCPHFISNGEVDA